MYHILVVGRGQVEAAIAKHFSEKKQKVTTSPSGLESQQAPDPSAHFIVLGPRGDKTNETPKETYLRDLLRFLLNLKEKARPRLLVYLSSIDVWGSSAQGWIDETTPPIPDTERGKILLEAEALVLGAGLPAIIFRLAEVYGPDQNYIGAFRNGTWPPPGPDIFLNLIHLDDAVEAMRPIFNKAKLGGIYIGVDHEPVPCSEFCRWLSEKFTIHSRLNLFSTPSAHGKVCRNDGLRALGYAFKYPTFRAGYGHFVSC